MQVRAPADYSELAEKALRTTCSLHPEAEITVLHVIDFRTSDLGPGGWGDYQGEFDDWLSEAREHTDELLARAEAITSNSRPTASSARTPVRSSSTSRNTTSTS